MKIKTPVAKIPDAPEEIFIQFDKKPYGDFSNSLLSIEQNFQNMLNTGLADDTIQAFFNMQKSKRFQIREMSDNLLMFQARDHYTYKFGFSLLSESLVNELSEQLNQKKVLEVGSGTGFLSSLLQKNNIDVTPIDKAVTSQNDYGFKDKFTQIIEADAKIFIDNNPSFDAVIMSWPDYADNFAFEVLNAMQKGQTLYYCGEQAGGCTGNDAFHDLLETKAVLQKNKTNALQKHSLHWDYIHDDWYVFKIK